LSRSNRRQRRRDHLAVAHDDDAVGVIEDLAEKVGDQDRTGAAHDDAADEGEQLPGGMPPSSEEVGSSRMTRWSGSRVTVRRRDLDHRALPRAGRG